MRKIIFALISSCVAAPVFADQLIAVVDGGSSSSRVHLYNVTASGKSAAEIQLANNVKLAALSKLATGSATDIQNFSNQIAAILSDSQQYQPNQIQLYVYATAGMRIAPPNQAAYLYPLLTQDLTNAGFAEVTVNTISGKMEGAYDWLALNYLQGTLSQPADKTDGVIDMGGASMEVAFATTQTISEEDQVVLNIDGVTYTLYSHSYLGLGQDIARDQYYNDPNCFPNNYLLPNGKRGTGNTTSCETDILPLINGVHHVNFSKYSPPIIPPPPNSFYLISGFAYELDSKTFGFQPGPVNFSDFTKKLDVFCNTPWTPDQNKDKYQYAYCFNGAYYNDLLYANGFNIAQIGNETFNIENSVNNTDINWTLGVALAKATQKK